MLYLADRADNGSRRPGWRYFVKGILHDQLVLIGAEDDSDRLRVAFGVHLLAVVVQVEVHLTNILMLHLAALQVNKNEAFQDAMIEDKIDLVRPSADDHFLLATDIGKALPKLQEEET